MKRFRSLIPPILLVCMLLLPGCARQKPREIRGIDHLRFTYSCGMRISDQVVYTLDKTEEGYTATVKPQGVDPDEPLSVPVDDGFVQQVEELLRSCRVEKWYRFQKRDRRIMDGIGFTLYLTQADGTKVDAVGYMRWPDGYGSVETGLNSLFLGLWEASGRELPSP